MEIPKLKVMKFENVRNHFVVTFSKNEGKHVEIFLKNGTSVFEVYKTTNVLLDIV